MTMTSLLLDSGFLYALFDHDDRFHKVVSESVATRDATVIVPDVTLGEAVFLARRVKGIDAAIRFLDYFERTEFQLEPLQRGDIRRARELLMRYADIQLDFVDSCVIAIAERLNIQHIGTIDQRDFRIIRPRHCDYFQLLPPPAA
jgi:uncharacterized protein